MFVGWCSALSGPSAQPKAHNPIKRCSLWQNGLSWAVQWCVPAAQLVCGWVVCSSHSREGRASSSPPPSPVCIIRRGNWSMGISHWHHMSLKGAGVHSATETRREGRAGGEQRNGGRVGGVFVAMAKGSSSSCWFACAVAHPFPFFLLPPLFLICVTASHSDKRFVHCVVGCGPFCFRAFTPSATHRDGRPCLPNTERGFLQVRRETSVLHTMKIRAVVDFFFFVNAFSFFLP